VLGRQGEPVIAIDGPSGSGKSTVAQAVARALGYRYLDTGAMYRAVTWLALDMGVDLRPPLDPDRAERLGALAGEADLDLSTDARPVRVLVAGRDVSDAIRGPEVTAVVSVVSAVPQVRFAMVRRQRELIANGAVVVEGRDIGTTVAPDAAVKVFLTAAPAARAQRRAAETADVPARTRAALLRRDTLDSGREASPLRQADDAVVIDSTALSVDEVVSRILDLAHAAIQDGAR
jgi:cytidylate kinase